MGMVLVDFIQLDGLVVSVGLYSRSVSIRGVDPVHAQIGTRHEELPMNNQPANSKTASIKPAPHHTQPTRSRIRTILLGCALFGAGTLGGCNNAGEGLFSGAALGAVTGLAIGSMSGDAGEGAAIGAILGGAGGAIVGDQNERNRANARYRSGSPVYDSRPVYRARPVPAPRRSNVPYCPTHRVYHHHSSHHGHSNGHGYHYQEWWND